MTRSRVRYVSARFLAVVGLVFFASWVSVPVATAASWRGTTGVVGRFIFSDNLFLSETDEETGGIIQVLPFVSSARNGRRVRATFNYGPSILWYPGNSDLNNVAHVLRATIRTEVIERYFFLDVTAQANQALINPRLSSGFGGFGGSSGFGGSTGFGGSGFAGGTGGFGSAVNPEAFTQTASIEVRPRIVLPIAAGRFATVRIEPGLALVATAETADGGGRSSQPQTDSRIRVVSGSMFTTIPWSINARRQLFDVDDDDATIVGRAPSMLGSDTSSVRVIASISCLDTTMAITRFKPRTGTPAARVGSSGSDGPPSQVLDSKSAQVRPTTVTCSGCGRTTGTSVGPSAPDMMLRSRTPAARSCSRTSCRLRTYSVIQS